MSASRGDDHLRQLRIIAGGVVLALVVLSCLADLLGRLFVDADFHLDAAIFGSLLVALIAILGIEVPRALRK